MPRDILIITRRQPDLPGLTAAALSVDPDLGVRTIAGQAVTQLCVGEQPVLSIAPPLSVRASHETARLAPDSALAATPVWWTEAWAPWGADGERGVQIAQALAARFDGEARSATPA
ncbi:MAG: hypothetical protein LBI84_00780 [Propionibacteriaceae bacterium]|nr:hypothetical protein [Propionibacteriaceae bacterium]